MPQSIRRFKTLYTISASLVLIWSMSACSEKGGTGEPVDIPDVSINCTSAQCLATNGSIIFTAIVTTSGCISPEIGGAATGNGTATCTTGIGCTGSISSWDVAKVGAGVYSFCGTLFLTGAPHVPVVTGDSLGTLDDVQINSDTTAKTISTWVDVL